MKILQVNPYYAPYLGGQERHVQTLARKLKERGHEVVVLTSNYPKSAPEETIEGIRVVRVPVYGRILRNPIAPGFARHKDLFAWADVVHVHNEHGLSANLAAYLGPRVKRPMVLTCHGQLKFLSPLADAFERGYSRSLGAWTLKRMARVIALSPTDAKYLDGLGVAPGKIRVVPNAIEFPPQPSPVDVEEFRKKHGLAGKEVILFVGPILARKAPDLLLAQLPRILAERPNVVAVLVGGGADLDKMRARAREMGLERHAIFTGRVSERDLYAAFHAANVLAVTSKSEGLPTVMLESLHLGLPMVASDLPAIQDWFSDVALLRDPGSPAFADALCRLLADPAERERMRERGRAYVHERFGWDRTVEDVLAVYEEAQRGAMSA
ncbi:MAG: hypothetical protein QOE90_3476 [Thermoplasmata archaeon]|jgi:glycosyltransferase involved in cell wall biosynthesis|nr:hypothetical protein [Thermoplasmata archaeon]